MRHDPQLTLVHAIAQGLLTHSMDGRRMPFVIRTDDAVEVAATLRTVAAAAGYSTRDHVLLPPTRDAPRTPPRHVLVKRGEVDAETAEHVVALAQALPDDAIITLVIPGEDMGSLAALGHALAAAGMIETGPDDDRLPHQLVPSARVA